MTTNSIVVFNNFTISQRKQSCLYENSLYAFKELLFTILFYSLYMKNYCKNTSYYFGENEKCYKYYPT